RATAPEMEGRLEEIDQRLERILPVAEGSTRPSGAALVIGNDSSIAPQFFGVLDVDFDAHGGPQQAVPDFRLRVEVRDGRIGSAAIPMTLTDVQARFYRDNNNIIFRLDDARGGETRLSGGFEMLTTPDAPPGKAWFDVKDFPVSMKLRPLLPEKTQRLFDAFQPEGFLSARGQVLQRSDGTWMPENVTGSVRGGTAVYHRFRYAASDIQATLQQRPFQTTAAQGTEPALTDRDVLFDVRVAGNIGEHRFDCGGWWRNPGIDNESRFEMQVPDLPIDGPFRNALEAKQLAVIESLNLDGNLHANLVFYRPPGKDRVTQTYVDAVLTNGSMRFARFPYDVTDLSGRVTFDLLKKRWEFHDLAGRHGDGRLMGQGTFVGEPAPGQLHLVVTAQGAALNADLYNALPRSQRHLWNMVQPEGFCDLTTDIHWTAIPGQPPLVRFPEEAPVRIYNTRIRPVPFPLDMFIREAVVSFNPNDVRFAGVQHCTIHSFNALHDESPIRATGWAEVKPEGEWQVHFNDITATNLRPDDNLRAALPQSWRQSLSRLTSSGSVSVENSEIDFRGLTSGQCNTTARWDMNLRFRDCVMNAGLDVSQVYGKVTAQGVWDGAHLDNVGVIQLETAQVLDMPITSVNGPYSLTEKELILGARDVFTQKDLTTISRDRRIKARAYGGEVLLDALVDLSPDGQYRLFTEVTGALLEAYAALHIPEQKNLRGVVKAWMSLVGSGDTPAGIQGEGQLQISPAALYELPVIVKLFGALSQLKFNVQDRTAFDYALLDFKVRNEAFEFERVDLVGESISLRGRGSVGFGGDVLLDFYSRPPRPTAASIPILNRLLTQWTKVEVRGTTSRPQTTARPLGQIDQGVQQFLTAFNPVPGSPVPMLTAPRFFTPPQPLLPRLLPQTGNSRQQRY
ncbi:MAG: hypothetical protein KDA81_17315, partial [Planctomycetaceae bacterium]|nr:hypothetical protein [Planctomycetaceae bacterium]